MVLARHFLDQEHETGIWHESLLARFDVGDDDSRPFSRRHLEASAQGPVGPSATGCHILVRPSFIGVVDCATRCTVLAHFLDEVLQLQHDCCLLVCLIVMIRPNGKLDPEVRHGPLEGSSTPRVREWIATPAGYHASDRQMFQSSVKCGYKALFILLVHSIPHADKLPR